jgi:hypothetical protein
MIDRQPPKYPCLPKICQMGWVSGVESQPYEFFDFQWCPIFAKANATRTTPLREYLLLISLVLIVFSSEPYYIESVVYIASNRLKSLLRGLLSHEKKKPIEQPTPRSSLIFLQQLANKAKHYMQNTN